jgi:O-antigen/teichoic acid export membrane protein
MWIRTRKALTAIFWSHALAAVGNLFLVPLYLTYWSAGVYGEWLVLFAVAGYLSMLDLGLNMATTNRLTQAYCRQDFEDYTRCQHSAFAFYIVVVVVSGLLFSGALWMFPLPEWLGLKQTDPQESAWVMWLLGVNVLLTLPAGFMWSMYRTMGQVSLSQWIWNAQQLLNLGMIPVILALGGGMKSVAAGQLAVLIVLLLYAGWDLRRRVPALMSGLSKADRSVLRKLTRPSLFFGLVMVSNVIILHGSVIVVSTMLGSVAVALFVTSRTLINLTRQAGNAFLNALWPEVTSMEARSE